MSASVLEALCRTTGSPSGKWQEADVTIRVTRPGRYEVRWRRWCPGSGWSGERTVVGPSLLDALAEACTAEWEKDEERAGARPCG